MRDANGLTVRTLFACIGLLWLAFYVITQPGCTQPPKMPPLAKVAAAVQSARDASEKTCDKSIAACGVYFEAVKAGLVPEDDRAELACAKTHEVCALVGAAGAP